MNNKIMGLTIVLALTPMLDACQTKPVKANGSSEPVGELNITMLDMSYEPKALDVSRSGRYLVHVKNGSTVPHDIEFTNGVRLAAGPGKSASGIVEVPDEGLVSYWKQKGRA